MKILIVEDNFATARWLSKRIKKAIPKIQIFYDFHIDRELSPKRKLNIIRVKLAIEEISFDVIISDLHLTNVSIDRAIHDGVDVLAFALQHQPETTKLIICSGHLDDWPGIYDFDGVFEGREDVPKLIKYLQKLESEK